MSHIASAVPSVTLWYKVRCQQLYENMFLDGGSPFSKSQLERKQALKLCTDAAFIRSSSEDIAFILRKHALDGRSAFVNEGGAADMCSSVYTGSETLFASGRNKE